MDMSRTLRATVGWALPALIVWALLAALWNFGGAWQLANGQRAPGPTASVPAGLVLRAIAAGLALAVHRWPAVFVLLSAVAGVAALVGVVGAFVQHPKLWPSEPWRWAGIVLNGAGLLAAANAVARWARKG